MPFDEQVALEPEVGPALEHKALQDQLIEREPAASQAALQTASGSAARARAPASQPMLAPAQAKRVSLARSTLEKKFSWLETRQLDGLSTVASPEALRLLKLEGTSGVYRIIVDSAVGVARRYLKSEVEAAFPDGLEYKEKRTKKIMQHVRARLTESELQGDKR